MTPTNSPMKRNSSAIHTQRNLGELIALMLVGTLGPCAAQQAFDLAAHFQHEQLIARVDVGDEDALAR